MPESLGSALASDLLKRYPGKRGSRKVRAALARLKQEPPGRKRSKLEERFAPFLRRHRLPLPRFKDWIVLGDKRYQVDAAGRHQPHRRARRLGRTQLALGLPRRPRARPKADRRRLHGHAAHVESAGRRT
jgi:hypothetical protein